MKASTLSTILLAVAILFVGIVVLIKPTDTLTAGGWIGFQSHLQSATTTTVGPQAKTTLFADQTSATCHARVVTTNASAIRISFDEATGFGAAQLNGLKGHTQLASTTVAYDAGIYGCGAMTAWGYASSTITISSF